MRRVDLLLVISAVILQSLLPLPRLLSLNGKWMAPVATKTIGSTSQDHLNRGSVMAIDWTGYKGSYVYPPADSKVIYSGCNNAGGYGCWYLLQDKYGYRHILAHFNPTTLQFKPGDIVRQSDVLGTIAKTGITSWYHTHWELSKDGERIALETLFDFSKMNYAKIQDVDRHPTKWNQTATSLPNLSFGWLGMIWFTLLLIWVLWEPKRTSVAIVVNAFGLVLAVGSIPLLPALLVNSVTSIDNVPTSEKFDFTYQFIQRWEGTGNKCVHDPIRTMNGITQQSYSSYLRSKGWPNADVCRELSLGQAKDIYYHRYYLASGADKLPAEIALQVFDMSVNAGVGVGVAMKNACVSDYRCYVSYRASFYRSARNCRIYCAAWFNRLNDSTSYLKGES